MSVNFTQNCKEAYEKFKKDDKINWLIISTTQNGSQIDLDIKDQGSDGIVGIKKALKEKYDDNVAFGILQINGVDIKGGVKSVRNKFIYISYIGEKAPIRIKARTSTLSPQVRDHLGSFVQFSLNVDGNDIEYEMAPKKICKMLLNAGGAHKPEFYDLGSDIKVNVDDLF